MPEAKQVVLLTGASGSMGFEAFKLLWEKRDRFDIVLLLRPSKKNRRLFRPYMRECGIALKIVWGDALNREDVEAACLGIDWCLHTMALISPAADRDPDMAQKVNTRATRYIVEAIEKQDPEHIRMVYIGSVAEYGDRLPPVHVGRTGDPVIPSVYDHYALSKIKAELSVMQSGIKHRVTLRQTFIMIPGLFSLMDPIMFHQPINSHMENITARDSGRLLISCLDVPGDSEFWGQYFNISGGPACRTTFLEFLDRIYRLLGINYQKAMERHWFALKNFHMQFYEDADRLDSYLHHWEKGQDMEDFYREVWRSLPWYLKVTAWFARHIPPYGWLVRKITYAQLKRLANRREGTLNWIRRKDVGKIETFYGSLEKYEAIPGWNEHMPDLNLHKAYTRLEHGYDESKSQLVHDDLREAAEFRGGTMENTQWNGDWHAPLFWKCCQGHSFLMTPHAVLKGGHWCLECISPPWNYRKIAAKNKFVQQVFPGPD